jgi:hypothetical protein
VYRKNNYVLMLSTRSSKFFLFFVRQVDPVQEWAMLLQEAWAALKRLFWDANLNGVDWTAKLEVRGGGHDMMICAFSLTTKARKLQHLLMLPLLLSNTSR